jgi:hypothetical protein
MHTRRLSLFFLGWFLGLTAAMLLVATHNFRGAEEVVVSAPDEAKKMLAKLEPDQRRMLLRYEASELNRFYFKWYLNAQIITAIILSLNLLFSIKGSRFLFAVAIGVLLLTLAQRLILLPEIEYLGRLIDFVPPSAPSAARDRFWSFHHLFSGVEVFKIVVALIIVVKMLVRSDTRRRPGSSLREEAFEVR